MPDELRDSENLSEHAKKAADLLVQMGRTVGLEGQQARLEALKQQALTEEKNIEDDEFDVSNSMRDKSSGRGDDNSSGSSSSSDPVIKQQSNLHDSLDAWLNDESATLAARDDSTATTTHLGGEKDREKGAKVAFSDEKRDDRRESNSMGKKDADMTIPAPTSHKEQWSRLDCRLRDLGSGCPSHETVL